ncbi:MAG: arsenate reductase (glutaredoxin) [Silicimonas sp.]|nr:arsenate reductase (glutaredoxin) [Silicimonas sp.]
MVVSVTIWHNPRCSKSRATLALLQEAGIDPKVRLYLSDSPDEAEVRQALKVLGIAAIGLVRRGEAAFRDAGLSKDSGEDALIRAMAAHPMLIERPVVFAHGRAAIGRPPEAVLTLF